jgi:hypothetical protein
MSIKKEELWYRLPNSMCLELLNRVVLFILHWCGSWTRALMHALPLNKCILTTVQHWKH